MHVGATGARAAPRRRRARRAHPAVQGAPAEALLRLARLGALRAHLRAARVLPDAHASWRSCEARAGDRRRGRRRSSWSSSARAPPPRRGCCSTRWTSGPRGATSRSTSSERMVREAAEALVEDYPGCEVHGVVGDFERHLDRVPPPSTASRALVALLGGTIGNFPPGTPALAAARRRARCSARTTASCSAPTWSRTRRCIEAAYDDAAGRHRRVQPQRPARDQPRARRRLRPRRLRPRRVLRPPPRVGRDAPARARRAARVRSCADLDLQVEFAAGEELRTEISAKFTPERLRARLRRRRARAARLVHRSRGAVRGRAGRPGAIGSRAAMQVEGSRRDRLRRSLRARRGERTAPARARRARHDRRPQRGEGRARWPTSWATTRASSRPT